MPNNNDVSNCYLYNYVIIFLLVIIIVLSLMNYFKEGFGTTEGTTLTDILKFGSLGTNYGYYIVSRLTNIKKFNKLNGAYYLDDSELYQLIGLSNQQGGTEDINYIIPMNILGKNKNSQDYVQIKLNNSQYPAFILGNATRNDGIIQAARNNNGDVDYFLLNDNGFENLRNQNIIISKNDDTIGTLPIKTIPPPYTQPINEGALYKYSNWECGTLDKINWLTNVLKPPLGYRFFKIQNHREAGLKTAPDVGAICFGDTNWLFGSLTRTDRVRAVYIKNK